MSIIGVAPSLPSELARVEDRISFVYLEHATIARDDNALTATTEEGVLHIPSAALLVLMLGPGTRVTHQAMSVLSDSGASVVWVGEQGVRYYAGGRPLARSTRLLVRQAKVVSNSRERLAVARKMYAMRFPDEDISSLTMQQLRGREGARVRAAYRKWSQETGVEWGHRDYHLDDFAGSDVINQAMSSAHACLYGLVHAVIVALGCSPGLGVVHTGHDRSFVFDIADLYKADVSIPVAFEATAGFTQVPQDPESSGDISERDISTDVRRRMRDRFVNQKLAKRIVKDIGYLLSDEESLRLTDLDEVVTSIWDARGELGGGTNFAGPED